MDVRLFFIEFCVYLKNYLGVWHEAFISRSTNNEFLIVFIRF